MSSKVGSYCITYYSNVCLYILLCCFTGNEQLARSGSNCLENLIVSTGKQFFPDMWDRVCNCISDIFTASLPTELLTWKPPERLYRTQSNASLASSFSSVSETPLPSTGRPVSVASVESSVVELPAAGDEETEVATTEASAAPEITVIPSSPPTTKETGDNQTAVETNDATSTNTPINAQDDSKNSTPNNTTNNIQNDCVVSKDTPGSLSSDIRGGASSDKAAVTDDPKGQDHVQQQIQNTTEEVVENVPLLNDETDHPALHDTPQHRMPTPSGKHPSVSKQPQQKEKKQKGTFLQRKKRGSSGTAVSKKKSNTAANSTETGSKKENMVKRLNQKLSHLQSPDADLAKSKFSKIGKIL